MKTNSKKDSAVSPVIGTILLVAITVVLVAIISAVVMGMTGNIGSSKIVGLTVSTAQNTSTTDDVVVTFTGGADLNALTSYNVTVGTEDVVTVKGPFAVGNITKTPVDVSGAQRVLLVGNFNGQQQVLYDQTLTLPAFK